jgi:hypothetical protein
LRRVELGAAARWIFPLDGPPSVPAGDVWVGIRVWRRLGISLRAGVGGDWMQSVGGPRDMPVSIHARPFPLSLDVHLDVPLRWGGLRIGVGPTVTVWSLNATGVPRQNTSVTAQPAASLRFAWRVELERVALSIGFDLTAAFTADKLEIEGIGEVARTPWVTLGPVLDLAARLGRGQKP